MVADTEYITVEVPQSHNETVFIFTGLQQDVDNRIEAWVERGEETFDDTRTFTNADWEFIEAADRGLDQVPDTRETPEYQRALLTQLDYDSTETGQQELQIALDDADPADIETVKGLWSRLYAARAAVRFRREQGVLSPQQIPERNSEQYRQVYAPLVAERERLAQQLALGAAQTRIFTRPTPASADLIHQIVARIDELNRAWCGLDAFGRPERGAAAWAGSDYMMDATADDTALLTAVGVESVWDGGRVYGLQEQMRQGWRYGVMTGADSNGWLPVGFVPDLVAYGRANGLR